MDQSDVNGALAAYLDNGDTGPWLRLLEAIQAGDIVAEPRTNTLVLRAVIRPVAEEFAARLQALREESGVTIAQLAQMLDASTTTVIRQLHGQVLTTWSTIAMMVSTLGGDPAEFREDYLRVKAEAGGRKSPGS